ncbi:acetyl-CoA synthetase-like protein, partial [Coniochaeta sp. PMI_546]
MVPAVYILLSGQPKKTVSGKIDRKQLAKIADATTTDNRHTNYKLPVPDTDHPKTEMELRVRNHWAVVLGLEPERIGRQDSFLEIGGDSISAIKMVMAARDAGLRLTVQDIFSNPRLCAMAAKAAEANDTREETYGSAKAFGLFPAADLDGLKSTIARECALEGTHNIEDAYPCTALQAGLLALAVKQSGSYIARHVYKLANTVDIARFRAAWETTLAVCENLRTRIVLCDNLSVQAVIREKPQWEDTQGGLAASLLAAESFKMQYGSRLCRYTIVSEESSGAQYFVLSIHHAIFDGWSMGLILETLRKMYRGEPLEALAPFVGFVDYATRPNVEAEDFWKAQLDGAQRTSFLQSKGEQQSPASIQVLESKIAFRRSPGSSITSATVLRAAWALVLARYCDSDDVTFGAAVSGRQIPVSGVERMTGPTVATVPVRLRLDRQQQVGEFMRAIQDQAADMIQYEQIGLQNIAKLSPDAKEACDFSTLMVVQPAQLVDDMTGHNELFLTTGLDAYRAKGSLDGYFSYPLVIQAVTNPNEDFVELLLMFDPNIISETQLQALSHHLNNVIQQLLTDPQKSVGAVSVSSAWDFARSVEYNGDPPDIVNACVHQLIEAQAQTRADALAIRAWDAEFTYSQLNAAANRLAHRLMTGAEIRVRVGDLVHVCFEKSAWFFVAILAINKVGAAWVPLDPSHPKQRQEQIIRQTGADVALSSPAQAAKCADLVTHVVTVGPALDERLRAELGDSTGNVISDVTPDHAVYVLFTSGSTGVPKGLVMQHHAVCTSQTAIAARLRLTADVRMLQFASFVFDLCIGEIIAPLISGAQLCVPSDRMRLNGIEDFIRQMDINWAFLTPAFARTIRPSDVPGLELLLLAGEAVGRDVFDQWFGHVRLVNGWGPAETCVFSTLHEWQSANESPLTVGRPVGGFCWIVDPEEPERLAPVGCAGEVVIQGPTILREYLADVARTKAATITTLPDWAPHREGWNRFFKSGDLCFYNSKGEIQFISRKDTQVKIRGLRVELGEVEHHLQALIEG